MKWFKKLLTWGIKGIESGLEAMSEQPKNTHVVAGEGSSIVDVETIVPAKTETEETDSVEEKEQCGIPIPPCFISLDPITWRELVDEYGDDYLQFIPLFHQEKKEQVA